MIENSLVVWLDRCLMTLKMTKERKMGILIKSERVFDGGAISYFSTTFPFFCVFTSCHPQQPWTKAENSNRPISLIKIIFEQTIIWFESLLSGFNKILFNNWVGLICKTIGDRIHQRKHLEVNKCAGWSWCHAAGPIKLLSKALLHRTVLCNKGFLHRTVLCNKGFLHRKSRATCND